MRTLDLIHRLDREFKIAECKENLVEYAVTPENHPFVNPAFFDGHSALFTKGAEVIEKVYRVVFITDEIIEKVSQEKNGLLFTHHHFDYYENEKGLQPLSAKQMTKLKNAGQSIYVAHAPLDTHEKYGTSLSLAKICNIQVEKMFFDYFGAPTALVGSISKMPLDKFAELVKKKLSRPCLTLQKNQDYVEKIGVVAGGGDMPEILQEVYDNGCDTLLTGTVEHRWDIPIIQEGNKAFHKLNKSLQLNLIGATHYATERPAIMAIGQLFNEIGIASKFVEDERLLFAE